jgi:hypothetical protein
LFGYHVTPLRLQQQNDFIMVGYHVPWFVKESPFVMDRATGRLTLRTNSDGSQVLPSLQFWDIVKRNVFRALN